MTTTETTMPPVPTAPADLATYLTDHPDEDVAGALAVQEGTARATRLLTSARARLHRPAATETTPRRRPGRPRLSGDDQPPGRDLQFSVKLYAGHTARVDALGAATDRSRNDVVRDACAELLADPPTVEQVPRERRRGAEHLDPRFAFIPAAGAREALDALAAELNTALGDDVSDRDKIARVDLIRLAVRRHLDRKP